MRRLLAALALVFGLAACAPDRSPRLHDVYLFGLEDARLSYLYGLPGRFGLDGTEVELASGPAAGRLVVPDALLVDGEPFVRTQLPDIEPLARVARIPLTTDLMVRTVAQVPELIYYDGFAWYTLLQDAAAGLDVRVVPRRRIGRLRALGDLSVAEADALADALEQRARPVAVSLLPSEGLPERSIDGLSEYLRTGLYLQPNVPVDVDAFRAPEQEVVWEVLARGTQAIGADVPSFLLITDEATFLSAWNRANASQLTLPPLPQVRFERETVLAVFLGQKATGGYGAEVQAIALEGGDLYVDLVEREPQPGAITTQALTSPWLMIRVLRAGYGVAWFRDPGSGQLFGAARAVN